MDDAPAEWIQRDGGLTRPMSLRIEGRYHLPFPPARVWSMLLDVDTLRVSIPGCQSLVPTGADAYEAVLKLGVGPIRGTFHGTVRLEDQQPPSHLRLAVSASGPAGILHGGADLALSPAGEATDVAVTGEAEIGGGLVAVGRAVLTSIAKGQLDGFFAALGRSGSDDR